MPHDGRAGEQVADALRRPGRPLDGRVSEETGARLGHDFSRVRVHTDRPAAESAAGLGAAAYTVGRDIVFAPGRYAPETPAGRRLIEHELGHVVQQGGRAADPATVASLPAVLDGGVEHAADHRPSAGRPLSLMPSMFEKVLKFAGKRLARRTVATVSKHIARHARGERVLRIVIDQTGRIVTAFPADRLAAIGLGVAALETLTARTAQAGEVVREQGEQIAREEQERESKTDFWEFVPFIGDLWGGSLNEGEDAMLRRSNQISQLIRDTIADVERTENRRLTVEERREVEDLIRAAITSPLITEETES